MRASFPACAAATCCVSIVALSAEQVLSLASDVTSALQLLCPGPQWVHAAQLRDCHVTKPGWSLFITLALKQRKTYAKRNYCTKVFFLLYHVLDQTQRPHFKPNQAFIHWIYFRLLHTLDPFASRQIGTSTKKTTRNT